MNDVYGRAVFAILMQNGLGIDGKAPYYINEKWECCMTEKHPEFLLDRNNLAIFNAWKDTWIEHLKVE